jgi:hypothetical protein
MLDISNTTQVLCKNTVKPRKPYLKPRLEELGDLRSITLGGSPGAGDSGGGISTEFPTGYKP